MSNDLSNFLLVTLCLFGSIATLLFLLAAIDPQTDRNGPAHQRGASPSRGRR